MLKHSIKSVVRSPWKSILFVLLLSAAILFVSLGSSMLYSAERMLAQADEQFNTVVSLKYGGLENNEGAWADQVYQENIAQLDLDPVINHPSVLAVDTEREIFAYAENGTDIKQRTSPFYDIVVFTFTPVYQEDEVSWTVMSNDVLFGDSLKAENFIVINPMNTKGELITHNLERDKTYLGAAIINYVMGKRTATFVDPATLIPSHEEDLQVLTEITDITDQPDYLDTTDGLLWKTLIESMSIVDRSFSVTASSYLPAAAPFHLNQTRLTEGTFETEDTNTCYISDRVAALLNLQVGDTWPLSFHYSADGDPTSSYWVEEGFNTTKDVRIAGIFQEFTGLAFQVYMPLGDWVDKTPDDYEFLRILVDNETVNAYIADIKQSLPENIEIQVKDQGYAAAVRPILTLREQAIALTAISAIAGIAAAILFSYLFISRQRQTARVMMMLGTGRNRTAAYLLFGILLIAIFSALFGTLVASFTETRITQAVWQSLQKEDVLDIRYSERAMGIPVEFNPELTTSAWVRWGSAGLLIFIIVLITVIFAILALQKPKRKKIRKTSGPSHKAGKGISFAHVPTIGLRFALRSISRNWVRSLIVPVTSLVLVIFIVAIAYAENQQQKEAESVYDEVQTLAYMTTFLGESREVPLHLQADIFHLLEPSYESRGRLQMVNYGWYGDEIARLRQRFEENNPYIERMILTYKMHYSYMGVVTPAGEDSVNPDLLRRPDVANHDPAYGFDWYQNEVRQMPIILFTDSILASPEFYQSKDPVIDWLDGYSDSSFRTNDYIVALPDRFMEENGVNLGDTVRIAVYLAVPDQGVLMEAYDFLVVGNYAQGSRSPIVYTPWSLVCYITIYNDQVYLELESPQDEPPNVWQQRESNEYLADTITTASIVPEDTRELSALRDYLEERRYSQVGTINQKRLSVVIEDKALSDAVESIQQHIFFMDLVMSIMLVVSGIIGFILSYLLTRHRLHEFAIMRSLGARRRQVYSAFFLEQFILFTIGILPILAVMYINPEWHTLFNWNLLWFVLIYIYGIIIAIGLMGRSKVLDILFTKE
jgi:ABC-type lipoprotein release transport system permease subunit